MKFRIFSLSMTAAFLFAGFMLVPVRAGAAQTDNLTKAVMSGTVHTGKTEPETEELQVSSPDKKKEVQIKLGDQFKAYILAGASPFKELNGKPIPGNVRAMFGFHIPLK